MAYRRAFGVFTLVTVLAVAQACGGGKPDERGLLAAVLPDLIPQVEEIARALDISRDRVQAGDARFWSNEQMASAPGELLFFSDSVETIRNSGRVDGYTASFVVPESQQSVRVALDLYEDATAAQRALEEPLLLASGDALIAPDIGDAATVWPQATLNDQAVCPCDLRFRIGPFLATVATSSGGASPAFGARPDPVQVALSEVFASRIRETAQTQSRSPS